MDRPRREVTTGFGRHVTPNTNSFAITDALLVAAAAVETILVAALALAVTGVGDGSAITATFLRFNELPVTPIRLAFGGLGMVPRQLLAIVAYGLLFTVLTGITSWYERGRS